MSVEAPGQGPTISVDKPLSGFEMAQLRIAAFAALKGWGGVREDGNWKSWNNKELREYADDLVQWSLLFGADGEPMYPVLPLMTAADIGLEE